MQPLLHFADRADGRTWLRAHHRTAAEAWLVYPRVHTGRPRIPYADAVEEALCVGWIDSTARAVDADHTAQRFTPRRRGRPYSQPNRERLAVLRRDGLVLPEVEAALVGADPEPFVVAEDIAAALRADPTGWAFFQSCTPAYQRIRVAFVEGRRADPDAFAQRLAPLVAKNQAGKEYGVGLERFYRRPTRPSPS